MAPSLSRGPARPRRPSPWHPPASLPSLSSGHTPAHAHLAHLPAFHRGCQLASLLCLLPATIPVTPWVMPVLEMDLSLP